MEEIGIDLKLEVSYASQVKLMLQDPTLAAQLSDKQALYASLPASDDELYTTWRKLEAHREFLQLQEVSRTHDSLRP